MELLQLLDQAKPAEIVANAKPFMIPIFAFSNNKKTIKQLSLTGSVHALQIIYVFRSRKESSINYEDLEEVNFHLKES
jgi:hypothetical protein